MKRYQYVIKQTVMRDITASNDEEALDTAAEVYGAHCDYEIVQMEEVGPDRKEEECA